MMEYLLPILDRLIPPALTAFAQSVLLLSLSCAMAWFTRKRHAICHTICFGAICSCLVCPLLTYSIYGDDSAGLWIAHIKDAADSGPEQKPVSVADQHSDVVDSVSDVSLADVSPSHVEPEVTPDSPALHEIVIDAQSPDVALAEQKPEHESVPQNSQQRPASAVLNSNSEIAATQSLAKPNPIVEPRPAPETKKSRSLLLLAARCFVAGWCLLIAILSVRMLWRSIRLKRLLGGTQIVDDSDVLRLVNSVAKQTGLRQIPKVLVAPGIAVPFVYGLRSPQIVIPEFLTNAACRDQLRDVLAHEMCHLKRGDLWKSVLQRLVQLVYCVNPLVHVIAAAMTRVREELCDNHALRFTTPADYCRTLLSLAERVAQGDVTNRPLHVLPLSGHGRRWSLEGRVADLLSPSRRTETKLTRRSTAVFAGMICAVIAVGSRVIIVGEAVADESTVAASQSPKTTPETLTNGEANSEAEAMLKRVLEKAKWWTGSRKESLKSLAYDYELADRKQTVELVSKTSAVRRSQWEGTTIRSGIHYLKGNFAAFDITMETVGGVSASKEGKAKSIIRFVCKRRDSANPTSVIFGNGIEGRWVGYFSQGFQEFSIEVDQKTLLPLRERIGATTVVYGDWKQADASHWVPGLISVRRLDTRWDMHFDWLHDTLWLLTESETGAENQKRVIARTLNVRVNDKDVERKLTERQQRRQQSTAPLRKLYEHNRLWLDREMRAGESMSYTFHTQREDIKEACYVNKDGFAVFEVTHDGQNKHEGTGQRKVVLPNGNWATGNRDQEYLWLKQPQKDSRSAPYGNQVRIYGWMGCQLDLPLFGWQPILNRLQATNTAGQWKETECDVLQINGTGRSAWLGSGTMLSFSSWSYVHHIYPASTTLYIDKTRHVPLHESIHTSRDRDFEIDYGDWKEVEPGQWVPMSINVESKDYFTCEMQFQLVNDRHWMLKEVTSWFDVANKSRGVVSDLQIDQPSELWNHSKTQLDASQALFSRPTEGKQQKHDSEITLQTTPLTFGKWVNVDRVKVMLTLASTFAMELKVQTAEEPQMEVLPVVLLNKAGQVISSGGVQLQQVGELWNGSLKVSATKAEDVASVAIAGRQGREQQTLNVVAVDSGKSQVVNVSDNDSGKTRVAEMELTDTKGGHATVRMKVVSVNGPAQFPVTANVVLFDEQNRLIACSEQTQSVLVKGKPHVGDLTIDVGVMPQLAAGVEAAQVSIRNGRPTSQPMGSSWGRYFRSRDIDVSTQLLFAADDAKCHEIAVQRLRGKLADDTIEKEFFSDLRDRTRAIERKQTRGDLLKPVAENLARIIQSDVSDELRRNAVRLLGHSGDKQQAAILLPLLESPDEFTRDAAAIALGMLESDAGFSRLEPILQTAAAALDEITLTGQGSDPDWQQKRNAWRRHDQTEQDVLISLVSMNSRPATDLLGRTLGSDLESLSVTTDDKGKPKLEGRARRVSRMISLSRFANRDVVPRLSSAVDFFHQHPDILKLTEKWFRSDDVTLAEALLAHEEDSKDIIAQQVRQLNLTFVYAIKGNRNPYYIPATREMLFNPSVESWMYQKGIEYLWSAGTPEAIAIIKQLFDHNGPKDYEARMRLCEALVHFKDARGLPEALALMAESFEDSPASADEKVAKADAKLKKNKLRASDRVLRRASDEMLLPAILKQVDSPDTGMRRSILHALRSTNSIPTAITKTVQTWTKSNNKPLQTEARQFLTRQGLSIQ